MSSWTEAMQKKLRYHPNINGDHDDGEFWMCFEDFVARFETLHVCRVMRTVEVGGKWHRQVVRGRWSVADGTAGGCGNHTTMCSNPQFLLDVMERCTVHIALLRKVPSTEAMRCKDVPSIGFSLVDGTGCRTALRNRVEFNSRTVTVEITHTNSREVCSVAALLLYVLPLADDIQLAAVSQVAVSEDVELAAGQYILLPSTFDADVDADFVVTMHSTRALRPVERMPTWLNSFVTVDRGGPWYRYEVFGSWRVAAGTSGGCQKLEQCPQFALDAASPDTTVHVAMLQDTRARGCCFAHLTVLDREGKRARCKYKGDWQLSTGSYVKEQLVLLSSAFRLAVMVHCLRFYRRDRGLDRCGELV